MSECSHHPCAPHGFNRNASHSEDRYVCDCEYWHPDWTCQGEKLKSQADALAEALSAVMGAYTSGNCAVIAEQRTSAAALLVNYRNSKEEL